MLGKTLSLVAVVWAIVLMTNRKSKPTTIDRPLTFLERVQIIVICVFAPLFGGLVFYYGWQQVLPTMAKQAGKTALVVILLEIILGALFLYSRLQTL